MFEEKFAEGIKFVFLKQIRNEKLIRECTGLIDDLSYPLIGNKALSKKAIVLSLASVFIFEL